MQQYDDRWHPISYINRALKLAERNYSATELECLGVVWAITKYHHCLYGRLLIVHTDLQALQWLFTQHAPTGRSHRWIFQLRQYDFTVKYLPGKDNVMADALSRAPIGHLTIDCSTPRTDEVNRVAQANDDWVQQSVQTGTYRVLRVHERRQGRSRDPGYGQTPNCITRVSYVFGIT